MSGIARPIKFNVPPTARSKKSRKYLYPFRSIRGRIEHPISLALTTRFCFFPSNQGRTRSRACNKHGRRILTPCMYTTCTLYARAGVEGRIAIGTRTHPLQARFHRTSFELFSTKKIAESDTEVGLHRCAFVNKKWGESKFTL